MSKDVIKALAEKINNHMQTRAEAVALQLKPVMHSGDAKNISQSTWYGMIRDNWSDPQWRQRQGIQRDPVKFVQDSLAAHGLSPSLLNQNKDVLRLGLSQWQVDANKQYQDYMQQYGGPKPAVPIPPTPKSLPVEAQTPPPPQPIPVVPVQPSTASPQPQMPTDQPILPAQPQQPQLPLPMGQ